MSNRLPRWMLHALVVAVTLVSAPPVFGATVIDLDNLRLGESYSRLSSGQWYTTAGQSGDADFRWATENGKSTQISANNCATAAIMGSANFEAGSTAWKRVLDATSGTCFYLRGRTQFNEGQMANPHNGKVRF